MNPTAEQVADAGRVLRHTTFCHRRTAIRPANDTEAKAIAIAWAGIFAKHKLELPDLMKGVEDRAASGEAQAPEPGEIVTWARAARRDRGDRETPAERADREKRLDEKISRQIAQLADRKAIR